MQFKKHFSRTPGVIIAVGTACLLVFGGCTFPSDIQAQREAARRAKVEHNLRQTGELMQKKAAQDSVERQNATPDGGNANESVEPE
ncbi:MAG: hypothetical protein EXS05_16790 [Planctomycetaceae bacterium]|nr:hypothetical protein [Planctomycetaceae bacterium]